MMKCKHCDETLRRAMLKALLIDMGCKTSDPLCCRWGEQVGEEHEWVEMPKEPTR